MVYKIHEIIATFLVLFDLPKRKIKEHVWFEILLIS